MARLLYHFVICADELEVVSWSTVVAGGCLLGGTVSTSISLCLRLPIDGLVNARGEALGVEVYSRSGLCSTITIAPSVPVLGGHQCVLSVGGLGGCSGAVVCRVLVLVLVLPIWRSWFMHLGGFVFGGWGLVSVLSGVRNEGVVKSVTL